MGKFIPVEPEKWAEMVIAMTEVTILKAKADQSEAENARLKAEVYRLEEIVGSDAIDRKYGMCCDASAQAENARLKAEVERLTFDPLTYLDDQGEWMPRHTHLAAVARLKDEVERLTKANAKEGKQP